MGIIEKLFGDANNGHDEKNKPHAPGNIFVGGDEYASLPVKGEPFHEKQNVDGPGIVGGDPKESTGRDDTQPIVTDPGIDNPNPNPGTDAKNEVGPAGEVQGERLEYQLGIMYQHEKSGNTIHMADPNLIGPALRNGVFRGICACCKSAIELHPKHRMVTVPQPVMIPRNRAERRALGLVGPNGKRILP